MIIYTEGEREDDEWLDGLMFRLSSLRLGLPESFYESLWEALWHLGKGRGKRLADAIYNVMVEEQCESRR